MTRKSKRELERTLDDLDGGDGVPLLTLAHALAADDVEEIDADRGLVRVDGTVMRRPTSPPALMRAAGDR